MPFYLRGPPPTVKVEVELENLHSLEILYMRKRLVGGVLLRNAKDLVEEM